MLALFWLFNSMLVKQHSVKSCRQRGNKIYLWGEAHHCLEIEVSRILENVNTNMWKDDLQWSKSKKIWLNKRKVRINIRKQFLKSNSLLVFSAIPVGSWSSGEKLRSVATAPHLSCTVVKVLRPFGAKSVCYNLLGWHQAHQHTHRYRQMSQAKSWCNCHPGCLKASKRLFQTLNTC